MDFTRVVIWAVLLSALATSTTQAADVPDPLTLVPTQAELAIVSQNMASSCAAFQETTLGAELSGERFGSLVAALRKKDMAGPMHLRPWIGLDWPDLARVEAPAALAVFPVIDPVGGGKGKRAGVVLVIARSAQADATAALRESCTAYFVGKKWRAVRSSKGQATLLTFEPPAGVRGESPRVWIETATHCAAANSPAAATALLATTAARSLAAKADVAKTLAGSGNEGEVGNVRLFSRPFALWELLQASRGAAKPPSPDRLARARRLGLDGIAAVSGEIQFGKNETEWQFDGRLSVGAPYTKALRALDLTPGAPRDLPLWVDEKAVSVAAWRWDFSTAMQAFGNLFDEMNEPGPDGEGLFDQLIDGLKEDPEGPQVDLRKELFARLGPEMFRVSGETVVPAAAGGAPAGKAKARAPSPPATDRPLGGGKAAPGKKAPPARAASWVCETTCVHEEKVVDLFKSYFRGDEAVESKQVGKFTVWTIGDTGSLFVEGESESVATIRGVAVGEGKVLLATHRQALLDALAARGAGAARPLAATPEWKAFVAWRKSVETPQTALRSWSRAASSMRGGYEQARTVRVASEDDAATQLWLFLLFGTTDRVATLPYEAVPAFDAWSGKLGAIGTVLGKTQGGWDVTAAALPQAR